MTNVYTLIAHNLIKYRIYIIRESIPTQILINHYKIVDLHIVEIQLETLLEDNNFLKIITLTAKHHFLLLCIVYGLRNDVTPQNATNTL